MLGSESDLASAPTADGIGVGVMESVIDLLTF